MRPLVGIHKGNEAGKAGLSSMATRGGEGRNRTGDTTVFSRVLHRRVAPKGRSLHGGNPVSPVGPLVGIHKGNEGGKAGLSQ